MSKFVEIKDGVFVNLEHVVKVTVCDSYCVMSLIDGTTEDVEKPESIRVLFG